MTGIKSTSVRDLYYGRQGGRWADTGRTDADETARLFANLREKNRRLDRTDPLPDRDRTDGRDGRVSVKRWPDPADWTASLRPTTADEWDGAARMAEARQLAGLPLNDLDREALAAAKNARDARGEAQ